MSETKDLTFDQFSKMCEDAGIATDKEGMETDFRIGMVLADLVDEIQTAVENFPAMNSAHEGFAVLKEEVDELWDQVKVKQGARDIAKMRKEAVQVAAMAVRFAADICHDEKGNN